ncbi:MAG: hypothetical protein U1E45_04820 [Geminicoccaceae bacterium]
MSDRPARRSVLGLLATLPALAACNLRPLHAGATGKVVNAELAAIEVPMQTDRLGQEMRNLLLGELNPARLEVEKVYTLNVTLDIQRQSLAIQLNDTITRYNLFIGATYELTKSADATLVYKSAARIVVSYNVGDDPYATLIAEQDSERRGLQELALRIRSELAAFLSKRAV